MSKLAIVTGGASGIGKAIATKLLAEDYDIAMCDVNPDALEQAATEMSSSFTGKRVFAAQCDVSNREAVKQFHSRIIEEYQTDSIEMLVNNAGIVGGQSFLTSSEEQWQKTFDVCWHGVYNCTREFVPSLLAAHTAYLVNISSANGYWASSNFNTPLSAYSTAKFAVKGFTESLIVDFKINAKHVKPILVMLGQVSTNLSNNSAQYLGLQRSKHKLASAAPTTPEEAAYEIWQGIQRGEWRIVVGPGAQLLDAAVRADPESAYEPEFIQRLIRERDAQKDRKNP